MKSSLDYQKEAFENMIEGKPIGLKHLPRLAIQAFFDPLIMVITHLPGPSGFAVRQLYYRCKLNKLGRNCIFHVGVRIDGPEKISIGDYNWIGAYTMLQGIFGPITIGKRIEIGNFVIIGGGPEGVEIGDYVGIGSGSLIVGSSVAAKEGKRVGGAMIPYRYKGVKTGKVVIEKDALIGTNVVILPGVTIGEGAVVGPNSVVTKNVPPWTVVMGNPPRAIWRRDKVTVPEL